MAIGLKHHECKNGNDDLTLIKTIITVINIILIAQKAVCIDRTLSSPCMPRQLVQKVKDTSSSVEF